MVDTLIPQAIRIKANFTPASPLCDDYETAACIGLICRDLELPLPEGEKLSEVQKKFRNTPGIPEPYLQMLDSYAAHDNRDDWRRLLECGYHFEN